MPIGYMYVVVCASLTLSFTLAHRHTHTWLFGVEIENVICMLNSRTAYTYVRCMCHMADFQSACCVCLHEIGAESIFGSYWRNTKTKHPQTMSMGVERENDASSNQYRSIFAMMCKNQFQHAFIICSQLNKQCTHTLAPFVCCEYTRSIGC